MAPRTSTMSTAQHSRKTIAMPQCNSGVIGEVHGDFHHNGGKDKLIETQEQRVQNMFDAFMVELRGFHEYIKRQDDYIRRQDEHLNNIVKKSYLRNKSNMERIDALIAMMHEDRKESREQVDRLFAMMEKIIVQALGIRI